MAFLHLMSLSKSTTYKGGQQSLSNENFNQVILIHLLWVSKLDLGQVFDNLFCKLQS